MRSTHRRCYMARLNPDSEVKPVALTYAEKVYLAAGARYLYAVVDVRNYIHVIAHLFESRYLIQFYNLRR